MDTDQIYRTALLDPPWDERGGGRIKRGADRHYPLMGIDAICAALMDADEWRRVCYDAHVWVWTTSNHEPEAHELLRRFCIRYVTDFVWLKPSVGLGQWRRSRHERLLVGVRGDLPRIGQWPDSVIEAPRGRHSEKPAVFYDVIEKLSPGPYLELFARASGRPGWTAWGNEVT